MSREHVELVRRAIEAATRREPDWPTVNSLFDSEHELVQLTNFVDKEEGTRVGATGFRDWRALMAQTGDWRVEVDDARAAPDARVAVLMRLRVRGERSGAEVEEKLCLLCSVANEKITRTESFSGWQEALNAIGASDPGADEQRAKR
jgi:ketosteroid isomerase-like protein